MRLNTKLDTYLKRRKKSLSDLMSENGISSYKQLVHFFKGVWVICPLESELPENTFPAAEDQTSIVKDNNVKLPSKVKEEKAAPKKRTYKRRKKKEA